MHKYRENGTTHIDLFGIAPDNSIAAIAARAQAICVQDFYGSLEDN
jgi:hypothetical protein